jgi:hypothetical protein
MVTAGLAVCLPPITWGPGSLAGLTGTIPCRLVVGFEAKAPEGALLTKLWDLGLKREIPFIRSAPAS